jgi:hypothetical protein
LPPIAENLDELGRRVGGVSSEFTSEEGGGACLGILHIERQGEREGEREREGETGAGMGLGPSMIRARSASRGSIGQPRMDWAVLRPR